MNSTRKRWLSGFVVTLLLGVIIWELWPRKPRVEFVRFEDFAGDAWIVARLVNSTHRPLSLSSPVMLRLRVSSGATSEYYSMHRFCTDGEAGDLLPGHQCDLAVLITHAPGEPASVPVQVGLAVYRPGLDFPDTIRRLLPDYMVQPSEETVYWSEAATP